MKTANDRSPFVTSHLTLSNGLANGRLAPGAGRAALAVLCSRLRGIVGNVDQPRFDAHQQLEELPSLLLRKIRERVVDGCFGDAPDALVHALGLGREVDPVDAPVAGLGAALDPALGLEAVDQPPGRRLLDLHHVGKLRLGGAWTPVQPGQHQPLRTREAELAHAPIEHRAHQPSDIGNQEADRFIRIRHAEL